MLTADLAISYQRGNIINPRYVNADDPSLLQTAADLILIVTQNENRKRAELEKALDEYVGVGTDYRILRGVIKLLTDRCQFETNTVREPSELRQALFFRAAEHHPVDQKSASEVVATVAEELGCSSMDILAGLYGDLSANQKLILFEPLEARELLDLYNVSQAQALLYRCTEMKLWLDPQDPKILRRLFAELKHYGLIFTLRGSAKFGYEITLSGPVSLFHRSQKYGIQMAVFLPALLLYPHWQMRATITGKNNTPAFFEIASSQTKLRSHYFAEEISTENPVLEKLGREWENLNSEWSFQMTQELIDLGETAFVPDAVFTHSTGRKIYFELFGYWTPRHLKDRLKDFAGGHFENFLLAISEELRCSREAPTKIPPEVVMYKSALKAKEILKALEINSEK